MIDFIDWFLIYKTASLCYNGAVFIAYEKKIMTPTDTRNLWYKNYLVLIFVIGLPVFVVIVCLFFIFYSVKIQDSTVRDDWYMDGKTLYQDASRDQLSYDLGLAGIMRLQNNQVTFELRYPNDSLQSGKLRDGTPLNYPKTLSLRISHATDDKQDQDITLTQIEQNRYQGTLLANIEPAKYYLQVSNDNAPNWRLVQSEKLPINNIVFHALSNFDHTQTTLPDQKDKRITPTANP